MFVGEELAQLESAGLLTTRLAAKQDIGFAQWRAFYSVTLTDRGRQHLTLNRAGEKMQINAKLRELQGVKVTAIGAPADLFGHKGSIVKYRVDFKLTQVGQALKASDDSANKEAFFALYDNGWRLERL